MCRLLGVSRSGYYRWKSKPERTRAKENKLLLELIQQAYHKGRKSYGSPRIAAELRNKGIGCSKNRIARIMRENGLKARTKRRFKATTNSRHNYPVADNVLGKRDVVTGPDQVWAADITYVATAEGWLYLAAILDLFTRQVVGWAMDSRMTRQLVIDALQQACWRRKPASGVIHHSDRGCQYASHEYQNLLKQFGFTPSMSRKGNCYDNAFAESFFHTLKTELIFNNRYATRAQAKQSIFEYIEVFYNRIRLHSQLGYRSPVEFEKLAMLA